MTRKPPCRQRKCACADGCGYTIRVTRAWMLQGLPTCPCGGRLEPTDPADLAFLGLLTADDVRGPVWTVICRENGWDDAIVRKGAALKAFDRKLLESGGLASRAMKGSNAGHCAYPGCGLWVATGAEWCSAGHAQVEDAAPLASSIPF